MTEHDLCPQCHHPYHGVVKVRKGTDDSGLACEYIEGGCGAVTMVMPERGGLYHEHCDCDYAGGGVS